MHRENTAGTCTCVYEEPDLNSTDGSYKLLRKDPDCPLHGHKVEIAPNEQVQFFGDSFQKEARGEILDKGKQHVAEFLSGEFRRRFQEFNSTKIMACWECIDTIEFLAEQNGLVWSVDLQTYVDKE